jgi:hypothetical protein
MATNLQEVQAHLGSLGIFPQEIPELSNTLTLSVTGGEQYYQLLIFIEDYWKLVRFRSFQLGEALLKRALVADALATFNSDRQIVRGSIDDDGEVVLELNLFLADMALTKKAATQSLGIFVKHLVMLDEMLRGLIVTDVLQA